MSAWRRKAVELFPDLRSRLEASDATIYLVFFELLPRCHAAHQCDDTAELEKIYGFADWCAQQKSRDLWNAAGVAFYEHLADSPQTLESIPRWVRRPIFEDIASLLEERVGGERVAELRRQYK
jgi:hypothetical protein